MAPEPSVVPPKITPAAHGAMKGTAMDAAIPTMAASGLANFLNAFLMLFHRPSWESATSGAVSADECRSDDLM